MKRITDETQVLENTELVSILHKNPCSGMYNKLLNDKITWKTCTSFLNPISEPLNLSFLGLYVKEEIECILEGKRARRTKRSVLVIFILFQVGLLCMIGYDWRLCCFLWHLGIYCEKAYLRLIVRGFAITGVVVLLCQQYSEFADIRSDNSIFAR